MTATPKDPPPAPFQKPRCGLSTKLILGIGGPMIALSIGVSLLAFKEAREHALTALVQQGEAIASTLNYTFEVLLEDKAPQHVQRIASNSALLPNVREVIVVDLTGNVVVSSDRTGIGKPPASKALRDFVARRELRPEVKETGAEMVVLRPLLGGKYQSIKDQGVAGAVQITLDRRGMEVRARRTALGLLGTLLGSFVVLSTFVALILRSLVVRPLYRLAGVASLVRAGDRSTRSGIRSRDELGLVSVAFDEMAEEVERRVDTLEEQVRARTAELTQEGKARAEAFTELAKAHEELKAGFAERIELAETVKKLSTPVLKVHEGVIVLPLIGSIDTERARQLELSLLEGIERHDARQVILDLTGVPVIDAQAAASLLRVKRCAELLGAKVVLAGVGASVAKSVVAAGIDLSGVVALSNLESSVVQVLRRLGMEIRRA